MAKQTSWSDLAPAVFRDFPQLNEIKEVHQTLRLYERLERDFRRAFVAGQESIMTAAEKERNKDG